MTCQHREWAPQRKIDAATGVNPDQFRRWIREAQSGPAPGPTPPTPTPPPPLKDDETMYFLMQGDKSPEWWLTDFQTKRHLVNQEEVAFTVYVIRANGGICHDNDKGGPQIWPQSVVDNIQRSDRSNIVNDTWGFWAAVKSGPAHDVIRQATGG